MRRGAAWPAERPSSRLVVREHKHGLGVSGCGRWRGGQGGPDTSCAVVTGSAFVSGIRCPVSGATVRWSTGPVQVTGVRCGRLSVQVSTVRPPASGVRCPWVAASAVSNGNEVVGVVEAGSRMAGMARGRRGRPPCPRRRVVCPRLEPGIRSWRRPCWASGGSTLDLVVVVGGG
jgi:hypothetical protein